MKNIKNISIAVALLIFNSFFAQVAIGKEVVDGNSTVLDFNNVSGNTKGVILPATSGLPTGTLVNGTFVFDLTDNKVKVYENDVWKPLSDAGSSSAVVVNNSAELGKGVIIGASSSTADGVLVLESQDKAMMLPKIATPHLNVKNPYPGMICYDTTSKTLAIFDGSVWNYWK
ncbi:hypothetical protein C1637_06590 [Chryseobacterium lactis]|uniref:Uncharacterized protein n=1 Tax=Chryseobacterium lactis TaxID=1241981 RepID=A0A3G6RNU7_CHRLC|nr:hypothetical protein [Chryseobacterium lactis]AZA84501.1 hypothetical protein EG342_22560 [Chryseobacterium lactis]AZB04889.1 hypothetical protein EG341_13440 [Chryseobacterium lactis]PNW14620.1 hypothetical protein C1637_06590 [Chryseobacterium lactis]